MSMYGTNLMQANSHFSWNDFCIDSVRKTWSSEIHLVFFVKGSEYKEGDGDRPHAFPQSCLLNILLFFSRRKKTILRSASRSR